MLKRYTAPLGLAAAVFGVLALGGCPVTTVCSPTDIRCQTGCVPGDTRPQCQQATTGTMSVTWTVNGQPPSTACGPANAVNVRFSLGGAAPDTTPCATGARVFASLPGGSTTLGAELIDAAGNVLNAYPPTPQTITVGATTNVMIAFNVGAVGTTGGVKFNWTVGGQAAATACPAGAQVKFESTAQPSTPATSQVACTAGTMDIANLPVGSYTFKGSLIPTSGTPSLVENLTLEVMAGQVAVFSPAVDFPAVGGGGQTGAAVLAWTVNGGQKCPDTSTPINITVSGGPTTPNPQPSTTCGTYTLRVPDLAAGTYSFLLSIPNPTAGQQAAEVTIPSLEVMAGADATVSPAIDITCPFCPQ